VERKREGQGGDKAGCSLIAKQCVRSSGCCRAVLLVEQLLCSTATSTVRSTRPTAGREWWSLWTWRSIRRSSRPPPPLLTLCQFASIFGAPRIAGDDGPGELLQPFEDGLTWNVRWSKTGQVGNYYTGAFKLYHLRVGAHDTDKSSVDLIFRSLRQRIEGGGGGGLSDLTGKET